MKKIDNINEESLYIHRKQLLEYFSKIGKSNKRTQYLPDGKSIVLEITTDCNLRCFNCNRSCSQAPSSENMSVGQISKFVRESIALKWKWELITIMGGEPTLHPNFLEILNVLGVYKKFNPSCILSLQTNGFGDKVDRILQKVPTFIRVTNTHKKAQSQKYISYNIAPIDLLEYKKSKFKSGCSIPERCGLGLTRYGYYGCGSGASVDRVFGFNVGVKKLKDLNADIIKKQFDVVCRYCGSYKINSLPTPNEKNIKTWEDNLITTQQTSPSWKKAYDQYEKKKPKLSLYK